MSRAHYSQQGQGGEPQWQDVTNNLKTRLPLTLLQMLPLVQLKTIMLQLSSPLRRMQLRYAVKTNNLLLVLQQTTR